MRISSWCGSRELVRCVCKLIARVYHEVLLLQTLQTRPSHCSRSRRLCSLSSAGMLQSKQTLYMFYLADMSVTSLNCYRKQRNASLPAPGRPLIQRTDPEDSSDSISSHSLILILSRIHSPLPSYLIRSRLMFLCSVSASVAAIQSRTSWKFLCCRSISLCLKSRMSFSTCCRRRRISIVSMDACSGSMYVARILSSISVL